MLKMTVIDIIALIFVCLFFGYGVHAFFDDMVSIWKIRTGGK